LGERLERLLEGRKPGPTMADSDFVAGWMDVTPWPPAPVTDWIQAQHLDLPYGTDPKQKLDLYLPNDPAPRPYPLLVIAHGGGFTHMDKADWHVYPGFFALRRGWAVASLNYRLAPKHPFPAAVDDTKDALSWLAAHAADYGLDPGDLALEGTSAGGNLVALAALQTAITAAETRVPAPFTIRSVALLCPGTDLRGLWEAIQARRLGPVMRLGLAVTTRQYLGSRPKAGDDTIDRAGIYYWLDRAEALGLRLPPTYLLHGAADPLIPLELTQRLHDRLARAARDAADPTEVVLEVIPGAGHAGAGPEFFDPARLERLADFWDRHRRRP
jgi:acetyl esterase/lipase